MNEYFTVETPFGVEVRVKFTMGSEVVCIARNENIARTIIDAFGWAESETSDIDWRTEILD